MPCFHCHSPLLLAGQAWCHHCGTRQASPGFEDELTHATAEDQGPAKFDGYEFPEDTFAANQTDAQEALASPAVDPFAAYNPVSSTVA
eukprot:5756749-Prorocentrum_lima.AAC.1